MHSTRGSQLSTDQGGKATVVADEPSDGMFVVADNIATIALWLPLDALVSDEANGSIEALDVDDGSRDHLGCGRRLRPVRRRSTGRPS